MSIFHNNAKKSSTTKTSKHRYSGCSLFTHCFFYAKNRGKDCMERFCKDLKEHDTKIMNSEKKNKCH